MIQTNVKLGLEIVLVGEMLVGEMLVDKSKETNRKVTIGDQKRTFYM